MVSRIGYEQYQLNLILAEYALKGYHVIHQEFATQSMRFDAIVADRQEKNVIIVEIINRKSARGHEQDRAQRFLDMVQQTQLRAQLPVPPDAEVSVDFRYIDSETKRDDRNEIIQREFHPRTLVKLLAEKLPPSATQNKKNQTRQFLGDWVLIARIIRAAAFRFIPLKEHELGKSVLEYYNMLLANDILEAAEQEAPGYAEFRDKFELHDLFDFPDLFQMHEKVLNVIEGDSVSEDDIKRLRFHLIIIRKQLKYMIKNY